MKIHTNINLHKQTGKDIFIHSAIIYIGTGLLKNELKTEKSKLRKFIYKLAFRFFDFMIIEIIDNTVKTVNLKRYEKRKKSN